MQAAEPDFTTSSATFDPEPAVAGSLVRYTVAIANTGSDSPYSRIVIALPHGYFIGAAADCAAAAPSDDGRFVWYEGRFSAGERRECRISQRLRQEPVEHLRA